MTVEPQETGVRVGKWQLDVQGRTLISGLQKNKLSPRAWETLLYLVKRAGEVVTKEELLATFWRGDLSEDAAVRKSILEIRRALEDDPSDPTYIKTITKQGYSLVAEVIEDTADAANAIAVLPFDNMTGDTQSEHLGDGLAEELINALAHKGNVAVVARNSSFKFKGQKRTVPEIAAALSAAFVVEGSIRRHEGRIRTTVQLIDARSGLHLFSKNFDHDLDGEIQYYDAVASVAAESVMITLKGHGYVETLDENAPLPTQDTATNKWSDAPPPAPSHVRSRTAVLLMLAATVVSAAYVLFPDLLEPTNSAYPVKSIAVLPFTALAERLDSQASAVAILQNDVIHRLSSTSDLTVAPRAQMDGYQLGDQSAQQIGDVFKVAYLLTGTVQRRADESRVTVQLVDTQSGQMVWSKQYASEIVTPTEAMEAIATRIASQLAVTLTEAERGRLEEVATHSWEAFQFLQQALAMNDQQLWHFLGSEEETVALLRQSLAADSDYFDAKYWLTVALMSRPDAHQYADELSVLGPELLSIKPDDPFINRRNAAIIGLTDGNTPDALARREKLLRHAVAHMGEYDEFLVDLALFLWYVDLGADALAVMRQWESRNPGIISPLLGQLELSFNHDLDKAAQYAEVILENGWGAPLNVAPFHQLRNDFYKSIELLSLPDEQLGFGDPLQPRRMLVFLLSDFDPDAALRWIDWLDSKQSGSGDLKGARARLLVREGQEQALASLVELWRESDDPAYQRGLSYLANLRAQSATNEETYLRYLKEQFALSETYWSKRKIDGTYNLRGFQMGWQAIGFAVLASRFDPQASEVMLQAVFDHYDTGAAHWNIGEKYGVLTVAHALAGDVDAAVGQFTLAEKYGFRGLGLLTSLGVFDLRDSATYHGLIGDQRFVDLVEKIKARNQQTLRLVQERIPQALEPGCYEPGIVAQRFSCSSSSVPTLSTR